MMPQPARLASQAAGPRLSGGLHGAGVGLWEPEWGHREEVMTRLWSKEGSEPRGSEVVLQRLGQVTCGEPGSVGGGRDSPPGPPAGQQWDKSVRHWQGAYGLRTASGGTQVSGAPGDP